MNGVYLLWMTFIVKFFMEDVYLNYFKVILELEFFIDNNLFYWNIWIEERHRRVRCLRGRLSGVANGAVELPSWAMIKWPLGHGQIALGSHDREATQLERAMTEWPLNHGLICFRGHGRVATQSWSNLAPSSWLFALSFCLIGFLLCSSALVFLFSAHLCVLAPDTDS